MTDKDSSSTGSLRHIPLADQAASSDAVLTVNNELQPQPGERTASIYHDATATGESEYFSTTASTESSVDSLSDAAEGEMAILLEGLNEAAAPLGESTRASMRKSLSIRKTLGLTMAEIRLLDDECEAVYGATLTVEEAAELMPLGDTGMTWKATIVPDQFVVDGKLHRHLQARDFDVESNTVKTRRPSLPVRMSDFFTSVTTLGSRYIFFGILNGWPSLTCLELVSIEQKRQVTPGWKEIWTAKNDGARGQPPKLPKPTDVYRATLRGAPWTALGWSKDSPGFFFWYEALRPQGPRMSYGTNTAQVIDQAICTRIHMVAHRYAIQRESAKDRLTYHSIALLEWDHGQYLTVVELAFRNGIGGYNGRSNWYHDKDATPSSLLFRHFPPEMIGPWHTKKAEIRCFDVEQKTLDEFMAYMQQYKGGTQRFIDPQVAFSHPARLSFRSRRQIAQYLLNYISRDPSYADLKKNCQTFCADFCAFIAGKRQVPPFHPVSRMDYQNRTYLFLYDSHMYEKTK